jgi:hypothetical protein
MSPNELLFRAHAIDQNLFEFDFTELDTSCTKTMIFLCFFFKKKRKRIKTSISSINKLVIQLCERRYTIVLNKLDGFETSIQ